MGIGVAGRGNGETAPHGTGAGWTPTGYGRVACADDSARDALGLRVTDDRVLIRADREEYAPEETVGGLLLAKTMAAAVEGSDSAESWFTGTIVQTGPTVGHRDVRKLLCRWLLALEGEGHDVSVVEIAQLRQRVEHLKADMPEPLEVGQRVAFSWQAGHALTVDGERYVVLRAGEVLAVLEE